MDRNYRSVRHGVARTVAIIREDIYSGFESLLIAATILPQKRKVDRKILQVSVSSTFKG
jgi:hypothetical protein